MLYMIQCYDGGESARIRAETRADHLAHVRAHSDRIHFAGPLIDEASDKPKGSLVIADFTDRSHAERFVAADPYYRAGLFEHVTIERLRQVMPE